LWGAIMYQSYPSGSTSAEPERPPAPAPVLTAVKLMYGGAAVTAIRLITSLAYLAYLIGTKNAIRQAHLNFGTGSCSVGHCHAAEVYTVISLGAIVPGVIVIVLWLWMARADGRGRNWARVLSTVLFGLATLELTNATGGPGIVFGVTAFGVIFPVLTWLIGAAAVWLLWRPASSAFFKPRDFTRMPPARPGWSGQPPRAL
jgi:hypothetical protein